VVELVVMVLLLMELLVVLAVVDSVGLGALEEPEIHRLFHLLRETAELQPALEPTRLAVVEELELLEAHQPTTFAVVQAELELLLR
jgi:hypothetical protein